MLKSSVIVMVLIGLGKITGLIRAIIVSNAFGTNDALDAFAAANQLPEVFFVLVSGGSLAAAFIPVYTRYLTSEKAKESAELANTVLTAVLLLMSVITFLGAVFAPWLTVNVLVTDYAPEKQQLTAELMRILLVQTTLYGISGVLSSILNAHQHFALPALADLTIDIGYFVGIYAFAPWGIHGLVWGTVVGALLQILVQVPGLIRYGFRYRPQLALHLTGFREILRLMGPRVVILGLIQLADVVVLDLTSNMQTGTTAAYFTYGYALMQLPETIFGTAIAQVVFPTLSEYFNAGKIAQMKDTAVRTLGIIWTLTIPSAVAVVLLGRQAIALLLEGGAFTAESTNLVYSVLAIFSVRIVSEATLEIVTRLFYAQHNTRTPMFAYLVWFVVHVAAAFLFVEQLGVIGIALASTVAFTVLSALLYWLNHRALHGLDNRLLAATFGRAVVSAGAMALVMIYVDNAVTSPLLFLALAGTSGTAVYIISSLLLGGQEIPDLIKLIRYNK
ncbi:MAG: murein biosynthesis integral membrane protein MurJ [Candidatus Promineifilaceae bacterium]